MTNDALLNALSQLVSEGRNPETMDIDLLSSQQILARMNQQDALVPLAVEKVIPDIALAVAPSLRPLNKVVDYCIWVLAPAAD